MPLKETVLNKLSTAKNYLHGFTIIEVIVTIVILGIALASVAGMVGTGLNQSSNTLIETRAVALGYSYLEEIIGRRYDERAPSGGVPPCFGLAGPGRCTAEASFGPDGGENRRRYDDVDDFHGLSEGGSSTPLEDAEGNIRSGYDNFRVVVAVRYLNASELSSLTGTLTVTDAKFVTVNVQHTLLNLDWDFSAYKGNY